MNNINIGDVFRCVLSYGREYWVIGDIIKIMEIDTDDSYYVSVIDIEDGEVIIDCGTTEDIIEKYFELVTDKAELIIINLQLEMEGKC